jgi:hypothetical protein
VNYPKETLPSDEIRYATDTCKCNPDDNINNIIVTKEHESSHSDVCRLIFFVPSLLKYIVYFVLL